MARPKKKRPDGKRATGIQAKSGKLYIYYQDNIIVNGKKVYKQQWINTQLADTPENVKKAQEERAKLLLKKSEDVTDPNITISDLVDKILDEKKREVADTTYYQYLYSGKRVKDHFGSIKVKDIHEKEAADFLDSLFTKHFLHERSVKDTKVFFSYVMEQAYSDGIIPYNPVKKVAINKSLARKTAKPKNSDEEFFSYDEAILFLQKAKDHELLELFYVTLFFGLRREEVLGLRWSAINFHKKTMTINHTVTIGTGINRINATKTKSSNREYPLTDVQVEMFKNLKAKENDNRKLCGNSYIDNDYVFKHVDGSPYRPSYPTKAFKEIIKANPDLPQGITFHGLRKSCVSILVHEGMDVKSIQKWVGHADLDTTLKIYAKVKDKESKEDVSKTMDSMISLEDILKTVT